MCQQMFVFFLVCFVSIWESECACVRMYVIVSCFFHEFLCWNQRIKSCRCDLVQFHTYTHIHTLCIYISACTNKPVLMVPSTTYACMKHVERRIHGKKKEHQISCNFACTASTCKFSWCLCSRHRNIDWICLFGVPVNLDGNHFHAEHTHPYHCFVLAVPKACKHKNDIKKPLPVLTCTATARFFRELHPKSHSCLPRHRLRGDRTAFARACSLRKAVQPSSTLHENIILAGEKDEESVAMSLPHFGKSTENITLAFAEEKLHRRSWRPHLVSD